MNEIATYNEVKNDGKSIHLYFNGLVGLYTAYGHSAFCLSKETGAKAAYSDVMQMPVVVINPAHLEDLIKRLLVVSHKDGYYHLNVDYTINEEEYTAWANRVRKEAGISD